MTAANTFREIEQLVRQAGAGSNGAIDEVQLTLNWSDYDDETYHRMESEISFRKDGKAVSEDLLDTIAGVRKLERLADGNLRALFSELNLMEEDTGNGQEMLDIVFKADGRHTIIVNSTDEDNVFSGTIEQAVRHFEERGNNHGCRY